MKVQTEDGISFEQEVVSEKWKDDFSSIYNSELDINDYDVFFYDSCCINSITMETDAETVGFDGIPNEVIKQGSIICNCINCLFFVPHIV